MGKGLIAFMLAVVISDRVSPWSKGGDSEIGMTSGDGTDVGL